MRQLWIETIQDNDIECCDVLKSVSSTSCVCSRHFTPDMFVSLESRKRKLKADAVPIIFETTAENPEVMSFFIEFNFAFTSHYNLILCYIFRLQRRHFQSTQSYKAKSLVRKNPPLPLVPSTTLITTTSQSPKWISTGSNMRMTN